MKTSGKISYTIPFIIVFVLLASSACKNKHEATPDQDLSEEQKFDQFLDSLKKSTDTDFEIINGIRKYLAERIDLGNSMDSLAYNYFLIPWEDLSVFHCLRLFRENKLTAQCSFASKLLVKLYNHAGYNSYSYKCGFNTNLGKHQFVLVDLNNKLIVEDAFYNITLTDSSHHPKDFLQLLPEIKKGDFSNVNIVQDPIETEMWLNSTAELDSTFICNDTFYNQYQDNVKQVSREGNRVKVIINRSYDSFTKTSLDQLRPILKQEGLSENYLSIYLKPLKIAKSNNQKTDSLRNVIKSVIAGSS